MRTNYVLMAMAALAIAGCSQNEITEQSPDTNPVIGFDVYSGVQTRGTENTLETIKAPGFGVMALNSGEDAVYMVERQVTYSDKWTYSNPAYWPADGTDLNFYAYAPHSSKTESGITTTNFADDKTPKIGFTVNTDMAKMVDLLAA